MIYHHDDVTQGSDEWLLLRCGRLTCSQMATACGKGITRDKLIREKAGEIITGAPERVRYVSAAMEEGTLREDEARQVYSRLTGSAVAVTGFVTNDAHPDLGYSPDGLLPDGGIIEIKNPQMATHIEYLRGDRVPPAYRHQVAGGLLVADAPYCDFISYYPGLPLFVFRQERDEAAWRTLLDCCEAFMADVHDLVAWLELYQDRADKRVIKEASA